MDSVAHSLKALMEVEEQKLGGLPDCTAAVKSSTDE